MDLKPTGHNDNKKSTGEELKRLIKDAIIYGIGRHVFILLSLVLVPIYTRIFSPSDYGVLELVNSTIFLMVPLLGLGLEGASARFYYEYTDTEQQGVISTAFYFRLFVCSVAFFILFWASRWFSIIIFESPHYLNLYRIAFLTMCINMMMVLSINVLRLKFKPIQYSVVNVTNILLTSFITIYLVVFKRVGIIGVFQASCLSTFFCLGLAVALSKDFFKPMFSFAFLKKQLLYGIPVVPVGLFYWAMKYCDRYFLVKFTDLNEVGLYSIGARLAGLLVLITFAFQRAWGPFVFSNLRKENAKALFSKAFDYYMLLLCVICAFISIYAKEILTVVTRPVYFGSYKVVGLLCMSLVVMSMRSFFEIGINVSKKTYLTTMTVGAGVVINLILNFILIPLYGMVGAAIATLASYAFAGILTFSVANRHYPVKYDFLKLSKIIFLSAIMIALGIALDVHNLALSMGLKFLTFIFYILAIIFSGIVGKQEIFRLQCFLGKYRNVLFAQRAAPLRQDKEYEPPQRRYFDSSSWSSGKF